MSESIRSVHGYFATAARSWSVRPAGLVQGRDVASSQDCPPPYDPPVARSREASAIRAVDVTAGHDSPGDRARDASEKTAGRAAAAIFAVPTDPATSATSEATATACPRIRSGLTGSTSVLERPGRLRRAAPVPE